jgi:hypothetical protein
MKYNGTNLPAWQKTNAWREIFARIFDGLETQFSISPDWLINPATNRRLKLDMLYPEIGVAIRFEGLQSKQRRRRMSLEEEVQARTRVEARVAVCLEHDIYLILVDLVEGKPQAIWQQIDTALGRAGQRVLDEVIGQKIKTARAEASRLARKMAKDNNLKLYVDLWQDRQYRQSEPSQNESPVSISGSYTAGMEVEHTSFGPGIILSTAPSDGDILITVDFITAGRKTLAASLVGDKLLPR